MGIPLPGETVALLGGFVARTGDLPLTAVMAVAVLAAIIGDNVGYFLGHHGGRRILARYGRYVLLPPQRVAKAGKFYARHGGKAVLAERWLPGLRVLGPWTAGIIHFPWRRFALFDLATSIVWGVTVVGAGFLLGASFERVQRSIGLAGGVLVILLLAGAAVALSLRHLRRDLATPGTDAMPAESTARS